MWWRDGLAQDFASINYWIVLGSVLKRHSLVVCCIGQVPSGIVFLGRAAQDGYCSQGLGPPLGGQCFTLESGGFVVDGDHPFVYTTVQACLCAVFFYWICIEEQKSITARWRRCQAISVSASANGAQQEHLLPFQGVVISWWARDGQRVSAESMYRFVGRLMGNRQQ